MRNLSVLLLLLAAAAPAQTQNPLTLIGQIGEDLIPDYTRPLVESYGVAMGSGLYHSARAHKFLGFDIGIRFMLISIPESGRWFTARLKACSLNIGSQKLDTFDITVDSAATIFGPAGIDSSWVPGGALGLPPALPGGLGITRMPFLLPQGSIGLWPGGEVMLRYMPWPFKGTTVQFLGGGIKQELTVFPGLSKSPIKLALQGFFQKFMIGKAMDATTYGGNAHVSAGLLMFTPYVGVGADRTAMRFNYEFRFNAPSLEIGPPPRMTTTPITIPVKFDYNSGWNLRATFGVAVKLGLVQVNADYNRNFASGYDAVNAGLALSLR